MRKTAIFVEGQTELIFVREYLLRFFAYQNIDLECRTLFSDGKFESAEYDFPNKEAEFHFQIINVGGDTAVLSRMLKREMYLYQAGYEKIIGLRDMFTEEYLKKSATVDPKLNTKFIEASQNAIQRVAAQPKKITLCFATMETEAWVLGMFELFERMDEKLTPEFIHENLEFNLKETDPENYFFQPSKNLDEIFQLIGKAYGKKKGDVEAIANISQKEDFENLLKKSVCSTFNRFHEAILGSSEN